jgi:hypothetical protein
VAVVKFEAAFDRSLVAEARNFLKEVLKRYQEMFAYNLSLGY